MSLKSDFFCIFLFYSYSPHDNSISDKYSFDGYKTTECHLTSFISVFFANSVSVSSSLLWLLLANPFRPMFVQEISQKSSKGLILQDFWPILSQKNRPQRGFPPKSVFSRFSVFFAHRHSFLRIAEFVKNTLSAVAKWQQKLFPLNCCGGFWGNIINNAIYMFYFVDNTTGNFRQ